LTLKNKKSKITNGNPNYHGGYVMQGEDNKTRRKTSILTVVNLKGGVSKTTTVLNLAQAFSKLGKRCLMIDMDFQGNLSDNAGMMDEAIAKGRTLTNAIKKNLTLADVRMGVPNHPNLDIICADISLVVTMRNLQSQKQYAILKLLLECPEQSDYDVIIVDSHPSLDSLFESILNYTHYLLIPVFPERSPYTGLGYLMDSITQARTLSNPMLNLLGVVITKFDRNLPAHKVVENKIREMTRSTRVNVFDTVIPSSKAVAGAALRQETLSQNPNAKIVTESYAQLAKEILPLLRGKRTGRPQLPADFSKANAYTDLSTSFDEASMF